MPNSDVKPFPFPTRPGQRPSVLAARKRMKMARSAHAYVRGSTAKFYEWLESSDRYALPDGPPVWICGDCHVGNLGPIAHADGRVAIQVRDLDHTVIGNPAHDLVRLGLSLAMAARSSDLPGVTTALMIEQMVEGYERALVGRPPRQESAEHLGPVRLLMKQSVQRSWKHLLTERLEDTTPCIPLGRSFWPLIAKERRAVDDLFSTERVRRLVTSLRCREDDAPVEVVDAAYWMKGCSSLGRLRLAVLVRVRDSSLKKGKLSLLDVKEAAQARAPRSESEHMPRDNGERVVAGAVHMAPFLGGRMLATHLLDRSVFLRELLPQDLKFEVERLTQGEAIAIARFLARVVGQAHARQMAPATRRKWKTELHRQRPKSLDAPTWLWSSIVELIAVHESAYLEHCRAYALEGGRTWMARQ